MAKTSTQPKRSGPDSLFRGKVLARRSGCMTKFGNAKLDEDRARLGRELGMPKPLSVGDMLELLSHAYGGKISAELARSIAREINDKVDKAA